MENREGWNRQNGGLYDHVCWGRRPFAVAELRGNDGYPSVRGRVWFYATPAGVLISADLSGLPDTAEQNERMGAAFRVCLESEKGRSCHTPRLCSLIPPLYGRNGSAWCEVVTGKLSPSDLNDCRVILRTRAERCAQACGSAIATGRVVSPA